MRVLSKGVWNPGAQVEGAGVSEEDLVQAKGRFFCLLLSPAVGTGS